MFCYKCGQKLEDNAPFCGACGARQDEAQKVEQPVQQEQPAQQQVYQQQQAFQQQMYQQQQFAQGQPMYGVPNKPKSKLGWAWITIIAEGAVALVLLIAFFVVNIRMSSPSAVGEKFVNAAIVGDIDGVYDTLYLEDSEFLTKDSFVRLYGEDITDITEYESLEKDLIKGDMELDTVQSGDDKAVVNVKYGGYTVTSIPLIKEEKNRFLFFPSWKVQVDNIVAKNAKIKVPTGAKIYIDDKEVSDDYLSSDKSEYVIPALFKGKHSLIMEFDGLKTLPSTFSASGTDKYVTVDAIAFSEDDQKKIIDEAYSYLEKVVNAHLAGQSFDSISSMFSKDSLSSERQSYEYASKYDYAKTSEYGTGITDATINNARGSFSSSSIKDGKITATVGLKYKNTNNGLTRSYSFIGLSYTPENKPGVDKDNDESESITLSYEDGKWLISKMGQTGVDTNTSFYNTF